MGDNNPFRCGEGCWKVGVIGVGSRGLSVLERLLARARQHPETRLELTLFEPHLPGPGCHVTSQPEALLLNTVASQVTQFPSWETPGIPDPTLGPDLMGWLRGRLAETGQNVDPEGYYPRALLGEYLAFAFARLVRGAPASVTMEVVSARVTRMEPHGEGWLVRTMDGGVRALDFAFMTTGHAAGSGEAPPPFRNGRVIAPAFSITGNFPEAKAGTTVAVQGLGLVAFDVITMLTSGRGGRFERGGDGALRYRASGQEPRILAFSRSGLPLRARAVNQKGRTGQYEPRFLTESAVQALRRRGPMDFRADLLPLLVADMKFAWYSAWARSRGQAMPPPCRHELDRFAAERVPPAQRFSPAALACPAPAFALASQRGWQAWLSEYLRADIAEARLGNLGSPLKAASDVLRDLRPRIAAAVDFGGLQADSHRWFCAEFVPLMTRLAIGPPLHRVEEMTALIAAGVLRIDFGPDPLCLPQPDGFVIRSRLAGSRDAQAGLLIRAQLCPGETAGGAGGLLEDLYARGVMRRFSNGGFVPGGLDVTRDLHPVSAAGHPLRNCWALGPITEGARFYTYLLPRPGVASTVFEDAETAVKGLFREIAQRSPARGKGRGQALRRVAG